MSSEKNRAIAKVDLLYFIGQIKERSSLTWLTGLIVVLSAVLLLAYITTKRVQYAKNFYNVVMTINFVEDIRPGTKIRFQAGLIVGEVVYIKSDGVNHKIYCKIKNNFRIPKSGSKLTMQTWGFFGDKFINVSIFGFSDYSKMFRPGDVIKIDDITNFTMTMEKFNEATKKEANNLSPLENQLKNARNLTSELKNSKYARPGYMRGVFRKTTKVAEAMANRIKEGSKKGYLALLGLNNFAEDTVLSIKNELPGIKKNVQRLDQMFVLRKKENFAKSFWHEERTYDEWLELSAFIRKKTLLFKIAPHMIIR